MKTNNWFKTARFFAIVACVFYSVSNNNLNAQTVTEDFKKLSDSDTADMRLLATYPKDVRDNLLTVSTHPEIIARLNDLQKTSGESFRSTIKDFSKESQSKIWNLTRYDQLVSKLTATGGKSKKVDAVLKEYPEDIHADARWLVKEYPDVLTKIDAVSKSFNTSFQELNKGYTPEIQKAMASLLSKPEIITILNDNMRLTVYLGDIYTKDPAVVQQKFDSLSLVVEQENAIERDALKQAIEEDPQAAAELKKSAEEFAKENGYSESEYKSGDPAVVTEYIYVPYPYWSGYPWWFEYNYWYPYPYWYHWGFYYHGDMMVWMYPPSWYFMHWYFYYPYNYYYSPHLCNTYINHYYYGPRRTHGTNGREVSQFMDRNEKVLPNDFRAATQLRADRIRELGKSEIDHGNYIKNNPGKTISRETFVQDHKDNYPALKNTPRQIIQPTQPVKATPESRPMELPPSKSTQPVYTQPKQPRAPDQKAPTVRPPQTAPVPRQPSQMKAIPHPPVSKPAPQKQPSAQPPPQKRY